MTTAELTNELKNHSNIDEFMNNNATEFDEGMLVQFLDEKLQRSNLNSFQLATRAGISSSHSYDICKGKKHAKKEMLVKFAFALNLSLDETNRLLVLGGEPTLRSKIRWDSVVIFCLHKGYSADDADEIFVRYGLEPILDKTAYKNAVK